MRRTLNAGFALVLAACGGAPEEPARTPEPAPAPVARRAVKREPPLFPQKCVKSARGECLPPPAWVQKLCDNIYPDLALHMFAPKTPWQRLYMRVRAEPFNATGGMSLLGDRLEPGEEVIALRRRDGTEGIQTGDNAGYDVLRWNGACATIHDDDFSADQRGEVRAAPIDWRRLSLDMRKALEADPDIGAVYEMRHRKCKGKSMGIVSQDCELYDKKLSEVVVSKVRSGAKLPKPGSVP